MGDQSWPSPTPRDEVLVRVVARGRRIRTLHRLAVGGLVAVAVSNAAAGVWLGASGAVDLVDDASTPATVAPADAPRSVTTYACPGQDPLGSLRSGYRIYLTGRDASGGWVRLRSSRSSPATVWVRADLVTLDRATDLPEVTCELAAVTDPEATASNADPPETTTSEVPTATTSTTDATATTTSTPAAGSTSTTTPPATQSTRPQGPVVSPTTAPPTIPPTPAPAIEAIAADPDEIWEALNCGSGRPTTSTVTARITNATAATITWKVDNESGSAPMVRSGNRFSATVGPFAPDTVVQAHGELPVTITITATGPGGVGKRSHDDLVLHDCYFG